MYFLNVAIQINLLCVVNIYLGNVLLDKSRCEDYYLYKQTLTIELSRLSFYNTVVTYHASLLPVTSTFSFAKYNAHKRVHSGMLGQAQL